MSTVALPSPEPWDLHLIPGISPEQDVTPHSLTRWRGKGACKSQHRAA